VEDKKTVDDAMNGNSQELNSWPPAPDNPFPYDGLIDAIVTDVVSSRGSSQNARVVLQLSEKSGLDLLKSTMLVDSYCSRRKLSLTRSYVVPRIFLIIALCAALGAAWSLATRHFFNFTLFCFLGSLSGIMTVIRNRLMK
jgi:hypothetical protein